MSLKKLAEDGLVEKKVMVRDGKHNFKVTRLKRNLGVLCCLIHRMSLTEIQLGQYVLLE